MAKLYTGLLAEVMQEYCKHFGILTAGQEGFRKHKGTARQGRLVQNAFTDARMAGRDIVGLFVDFSSAFNTGYHGQLLQTMAKLGFPACCTKTVASLYDGSFTQVCLAGGKTPPVHVERGTLQGDSLSPLLFIIALEPLLRWLYAGGRGVRLGPSRAGQLKVASAASDDLLILAESAEDLAIQARKLELFSGGTGLQPNLSKCMLTGALWGTCQSWGDDHPFSDRYVHMVQDRLQGVQLAGGTPDVMDPVTDSYRYLGVDLMINLNWRHHMTRSKKASSEKGDALLASALSPKQMMKYIQSVIRPGITYAFPWGAFTYRDIRELDAILGRLVGMAFGLPRSTPTALVCRLHEDGGMGLQSLLVDYVQITASSLTQALNDDGPLGQSTRDLLLLQLQQFGGRQLLHLKGSERQTAMAKNTAHLHLLRQLCLLKDHDITKECPAGADPALEACMHNFFHELPRHEGLLGSTAEDWKEQAVMKYMPALFECGLSTLDEAVQCKSGRLIMRPASSLRLLSGARLPKRHKIAYNQMTILLNQGTVSHSQAINNLPEASRIVNDLELLGGLCYPQSSRAGSRRGGGGRRWAGLCHSTK